MSESNEQDFRGSSSKDVQAPPEAEQQPTSTSSSSSGNLVASTPTTQGTVSRGPDSKQSGRAQAGAVAKTGTDEDEEGRGQDASPASEAARRRHFMTLRTAKACEVGLLKGLSDHAACYEDMKADVLQRSFGSSYYAGLQDQVGLT
jgi:hypothetical protein